jgi:SOS-response transcriptional repressor LexA
LHWQNIFYENTFLSRSFVLLLLKRDKGGTAMPRTSNKAQLIMDYVNQFIQENGYSPSVREIGAAVGLRSTASVSYHLQALQDKGLLQAPGSKGRLLPCEG